MPQWAIRDDPVQVDKAVRQLQVAVIGWRQKWKDTEQERKRLINRLEAACEMPDKNDGLIVKVEKRPKGRIDTSIDILKWKTPQFVQFFLESYKKKYGHSYTLSGKAWGAAAMQISSFRKAHPEIQDNEVYRDMIKWLFKYKFSKTFTATVGLITGNGMFNQWRTITRKPPKSRKATAEQIIRKTTKNPEELDKLLKEAF